MITRFFYSDLDLILLSSYILILYVDLEWSEDISDVVSTGISQTFIGAID